jgi:enoyl-CoA hydratase
VTVTDGPVEPERAVLTEQRGRVLLITLNRPHAMNAFNGALSQGLWAAVQQLNDDPGLTAGVLTGAGRGFCAGMDLKAFGRGEDIGPMLTFIQNGATKPLIGAIEGFALAGGLELALTCDLLVAARGAKLGIPEVAVGLFAAGGGLLRLPSRVGYSRAMEMAIDKGEAVTVAMELAERVARNAPLAVAASKQLIKATQGATDDEFWAIQAPLQAKVFTSADAAEGPRAFVEKRPPQWTGG